MSNDALLSALLTSPGTYKLANPTTTPEDYALIREVIRRLPESPAVVRMNEDPKTIANAQVTTGTPEIQLFRHGKVYQSGDPLKIAGTVLHENTHLQEEGTLPTKAAYEISARRKQLGFLKNAQSRGEFQDKGYLRHLNRMLEYFYDVVASESRDPKHRLNREALLQVLKGKTEKK